MKRIVYWLSLVFIVVSAYFSFQIFLEQKKICLQAAEVADKVKQVNNRACELVHLNGQPLKEVSFYYAAIYEALQSLRTFYDLKLTMELAEMGSEEIKMNVKSSRWEGVDEVMVKFHFYEISYLAMHMNVLGFLREIQEKYPIEVISIHYSGAKLEILFKILGRAI